ncbi:hypothetical protein ACTXT7_006842 [Hymenolepis weldensis]
MAVTPLIEKSSSLSTFTYLNPPQKSYEPLISSPALILSRMQRYITQSLAIYMTQQSSFFFGLFDSN